MLQLNDQTRLLKDDVTMIRISWGTNDITIRNDEHEKARELETSFMAQRCQGVYSVICTKRTHC
jgi:hypothetical protein